jgi:hypothetical protein
MLENLTPPEAANSTPGQAPALPLILQRSFTLRAVCSGKTVLTLSAAHDTEQISRQLDLEMVQP